MGETLSCEYLKSIGYKIIERNFYCKQGEIDIVAKDGNEYVFVEVKTRSGESYGKAREAVNNEKKKHIYRSTRYYLYIHKLNNAFVRFDVIEIYLIKNKYRLNHLKNVDII